MFYDHIKNGINIKKNETIIQSNKKTMDDETVVNEIKAEEDVSMELGIDLISEDEIPLLEIKKVKNKECKELNVNTFACDPKFKCLTCFEKFGSQNILINHYNGVHKRKEKAKNSYKLVTEDGKVVYKCDKCDKTYDNIRKIHRHSEVHTGQRFHCKICSRTYKTVSEIVRHSRAHDGTKVSCSFGCGFATVYSGALKNHESRHRKDFKYKCETCSKSFQVKTWYDQHQNVHTGVKPYVCDLCGLAFYMDRYLTSHRSAVHPDASSLDRYICVQCSKACGNMKALTLHLKEHGITSSLLCDLCGKTLSSAEHLKIHRRMHLGIKPFSCTTCDKSFSKKYNLKLHLLSHTGVRAYACECGKQYTQKSALSRHVARIHNCGAQRCSKCDKAFTTRTQLESHRKLCS